MPLIIDGYNLLHVTGIFGRAGQQGAFEASRTALLDFLVSAIAAKELARSVIVFDGMQAPLGLPHEVNHQGLRTLFSRNKEDADTLIERLIEECLAPRKLTVVSSDHRLHRAARRRRAAVIDSDRWYLQLLQERATAEPTRGRRPAADAAEAKPGVPLPRGEVERWVAEFGPFVVSEMEAARFLPPSSSLPAPAALSDSAAADAEADTGAKKKKGRPRREATSEREKPSYFHLGNPFPPGYADDLFEEE